MSRCPELGLYSVHVHRFVVMLNIRARYNGAIALTGSDMPNRILAPDV